ncbi:RxLR effector protein, partial [Phytophthora megakarya]
MRIGHTVLLAIAILSTTDASTPLTSSRTNHINIASRYLRFDQEEMDSEERNAVEKITKLFNSKAKPPKIPDKKK